MTNNSIEDMPHVLVVDDDDRLRTLLAKYLGDNGLIVTPADGAEEARRRMQSLTFDIIVLDLMMPGETGLEFAEKLRSQTKIKLMVTGGFRTQPAMDAALASNALDLIGVARPLAIEPDVADRWLEGKQPKHEIKPIKTHLPPVDNAGLLEIFWYAAQFKDMGQGKAPNPKLSPYKVLFHYIKGNVKAMIKGGKKKPSRLRAK